jgi:diguanylate cyclase (GGDEF)-like protein/PAS domain S-box-containing protein
MRQLADAYRQQIESRQAALEQNAREIELTRYMSDSAADIIVLRDAQGHIAYRNQRARECFDGCHQDTLQQLFASALPDGDSAELQLMCCHGPVTLEVKLSSVDYHGEAYRCATARDIGDRIEQERELRLASKVFEASTEAILITDADSRIVAVNQAFTAITGYSEAEALGQSPALLSSGKHDGDFFHSLWNHLAARGQWAGEIWNRRKSGEIYPEWLSINALRDSHGTLTNYIALFSDISERKEAEARVQHLAEYDYLTDLPNRLLLMDRLQQSLRVAERSRHKVAVLFMDLDRFKNINDTLGHATGDTLLQEVARRTRAVVRDMDTVGRTGGDEFVMILPELADNAQAALIAERVILALREPFILDGHQLVITASIGISISPDDGRDAQLLLKNADMAMYEAKAQGRNNYRFFTERMTAEVRQRLLLENRLRGALARQELYMVLQPKFWVADRRLSGFEALLRWTDADGVATSPAEFIPVAEESGLIIEIGAWVLRQACQLAAAWPQQGTSLTMAVNVSPRQLVQPGFAALVASILQETGLAPAQLEIEVTESALLERTGNVKAALDGLKALGVRLAVDDFGTGYSSLAYLKDFAPDTVKIDRCFVTDLQHRQDNAAIVLAIITLAKSLKMEALAEGVETEEELAALSRLGCEAVQGYLTGRPLSLQDAAGLVAARGPAPSP